MKGGEIVKYIIRKISTLILTLFIVSIFTFTAFQVIPGDSVLSTLGMDASPEAIQALRQERGLNENLALRYGRWLGNVLQGDFGKSTQYNMEVGALVSNRLTVTVGLALLSNFVNPDDDGNSTILFRNDSNLDIRHMPEMVCTRELCKF